jgi:hypothetical protein
MLIGASKARDITFSFPLSAFAPSATAKGFTEAIGNGIGADMAGLLQNAVLAEEFVQLRRPPLGVGNPAGFRGDIGKGGFCGF